MTGRALLDGFNLGLTAGTGIATYARGLAEALQANGWAVDVACSLPRPVPADPVLREIALFEGRPDATSGTRRAAEWLSARLGRSHRLPLAPVRAEDGIVIRPPSSISGAGYQVGHRVFERARLHFRAHRSLAELAASPAPDIAHFTCPLPLRLPGAPNLYTIHDLVPLRLPYAVGSDTRGVYDLLKEVARRADHIVTVSETTRQDVMRILGVPEARVTTTFQSVAVADPVGEADGDGLAAELRGLHGLEPRGYFLFFGAIEPKKNVGRLLDAFLASGLDRELVVVSSSGWQNEDELARLRSHARGPGGGGGPRLRLIAHLARPALVSLIRGARAVLFPSLYEGFGLPAVEAMALGTPVLASTGGALPEIAADAALLVDPLDTEAIRRGIRTLDADADLRGDLAARGRVRAEHFSPARHRARIAAVYAGLGVTLPEGSAAVRAAGIRSRDDLHVSQTGPR